ncbi:hypothetical protein DLJ53_29665 [Acuticoccus sediminis]|uniref:Flavin reductase like domain-containing protein n=1 Tax=Acuticoccus sediminis TaxID=2184697 RepID=A0A8B2NM85_9HYPH|nr:flavin reductase family protein [Acuticoccus sediminis]RAH97366.1 hypothetical protein DLJ53_29665 [Acuticoccus sediminis]
MTESAFDTVGPAEFKKVAGRWASGCAVISSVGSDGHFHGVTMSAVTSLSLDPMQFLVCLAHSSRTFTAVTESQRFAINMLAAGQQDLAMHFASRHDDKFDSVPHVLHDKVPVISGALGYVVCKAARILDGGDHAIIIGDVAHLGISEGEPLLYYAGRFGHFVHGARTSAPALAGAD